MANHATSTENSASDHASQQVGHHVPMWLLVTVLVVLLVLTFVTVGATWVDLGAWNVWIALGIATVKAILVALFFMHLAYDRPINAIILCSTLLFVAVFVGAALLDVFHYRENVHTFRTANPDRVAPRLELERERMREAREQAAERQPHGEQYSDTDSE